MSIIICRIDCEIGIDDAGNGAFMGVKQSKKLMLFNILDILRKYTDMEESTILSDFFLEREFEDSELRLLIDGLLFSTHLPYSQCKGLEGYGE